MFYPPFLESIDIFKMKCDLCSSSAHGVVQYAQNCIIFLETMQLSGLVGLAQSSEWSVFRTEV